jgi:hypothetical protein
LTKDDEIEALKAQVALLEEAVKIAAMYMLTNIDPPLHQKMVDRGVVADAFRSIRSPRRLQ